MKFVYQNKNNVELTHPVFRPLPCQVEDQRCPLHRPDLLKVKAEEACLLNVHLMAPKNTGVVLLCGIILYVLDLGEGGLVGNLGGHLAVGEASDGEDGHLLVVRDRVQGVNEGDAGLDHCHGVVTRGGIDGHAVGIKVDCMQHLGGRVDNLDGPVE